MTRNTIHTRLLIQDFQACLHFYRDVMGFEVTWEDESYASFQEGEIRFSIFKRDLMAEALGTTALPANADSQDSFALIFEVADVDQEYQLLKEKGIIFEKAPQNYHGWGIRAAYFRDPDGSLIEINSGIKDAD